jgi:hypothetical protein
LFEFAGAKLADARQYLKFDGDFELIRGKIRSPV